MKSRRAGRALVVLVALGLLAAGCASSSPSATTTYIAAGQIPKADLPHVGAHGNVRGTDATIPLAKQNPTTALFSAVATFQSCLTGRGVTFAGAPDPKNPSSPTNNPNYLKSLGACAAQSNILQALKAEQSAQDNLTPTQVKNENKQYLLWRKCMVARGWGIPTPTPNSKGLLFSFGGTGGGAQGQFTPPPGENLFSSPDLQACAAKAQGEST
jgi:hypothetical protein